MRNLITYFIKFPVAGNVIMILFLIFGFFGLNRLQKTFFPLSESKIINIRVIYPGASPEEVEEGIVQKIEENLKGVTGIENISSVSSENNGSIVVEVLKEFKTDNVLLDVKNAVDRVSSYPDGIEKPVVYKQEATSFAINFALYGDVDLKTLKSFAEKSERELLEVDGISKIDITGYPEEEIEIKFKEIQLEAYQLTIEEVTQAIKKNNTDITGGTIKTASEELLIRAKVKRYYADDLRNIVIKQLDNKIIRLNDVADVIDSWSDTPNRSFLNGKPAVILNIKNTNDEDLIYIADYIRNYVDDFNQRNDVIKAKVVRDGSITIRQRIELLTNNGLTGFFLVLLFLTLFLNYRLALWVAASIPIAFAGMFIIGAYFGITINVMSLFGMILVIGILVDDGIVIAENIYQNWEKGMSPIKAAIEGTLQVLPAVISAILTTVVAFSTFFFLDGRLGDFAPDMAFVVISTLVISLIEGAIILPAHVAYSKSLDKTSTPSRIDKFMKRIENKMNQLMNYLRYSFYKPILLFCLNHKILTLSFIVSLFIITIGGIRGGIIKLTFFPFIESDALYINLELPAGSRETQTETLLRKIEIACTEVNNEIKSTRQDSLDVIENIETTIGPSTNKGVINLRLLDSERRNMLSFLIANKIRDKVGPIPQAEKLTYGSNTPFGKAVSVSLLGYDLNELFQAKEDLKNALNEMSSLKDIQDNDQKGIKEIKIQLKEKAYLLGFTTNDILNQIRKGFFGSEVQRVQRGADEIKIWVRFELNDRASLLNLEQMRIQTKHGISIPLSELITYKIDRGTIAINHLNGKREIKVEADMANPNESATDLNNEVEYDILPQILAKYPSVSYSFEGQSKQSAKTAGSGKKVIPIILILMIALVTLTFRSFGQAIIIFLIIPLGLIGVGWGHYIHNSPISLLSFFGIIALIGIMVNDSLVLISAFNDKIKEGISFFDSVVISSLSRFRPIVLTSLTTIAGLAPLILEKSRQAQFLIPMAISIAYGLAIATITTLFILPVVLVILNDIKRSWGYIVNVFTELSFNATVPNENEVEPAVQEKKLHEKYKNDLEN